MRKLNTPVYLTRAARPEPIIIIDAVYTRCAIQHDKSVAVNCLILFMTNWNKVKCPVDRLNLLCYDATSGLDTVHCSATKQAGALTPRLLHALSVE